MTTLHEGFRSVGILRYHVDDLMAAGDESDPLYLSSLASEARMIAGSWEVDTFEMCGCSVHQKRDGCVEVDQTAYARAIPNISLHSTQTTTSTRDAFTT